METLSLIAATYLQQVDPNHVDKTQAQRHYPSHSGVRCGLVQPGLIDLEQQEFTHVTAPAAPTQSALPASECESAAEAWTTDGSAADAQSFLRQVHPLTLCHSGWSWAAAQGLIMGTGEDLPRQENGSDLLSGLCPRPVPKPGAGPAPAAQSLSFLRAP